MDPCCQHLPPRPIPYDFQCQEKIIVDDENENDNDDGVGPDVVGKEYDDDSDDDSTSDCDGYTYQFSCTVPLQQQLQQQQQEHESVATSSSNLQPPVQSNQRSLTFQCRGRSVGVMLESDNTIGDEVETDHDDDDDDDDDEPPMLDPFFFDEGYTLAGRTGFQVWAGSRLLLESLLYPFTSTHPQSSPASESTSPSTSDYGIEDPPRLQYWQQRILRIPSQSQTQTKNETPHRPLKILELGSGVGLVGSSFAALGHQVVLTDLPTLIKHSVIPNMKLNSYRKSKSIHSDRQSATEDPPSSPSWLSSITFGDGDNQKKGTKVAGGYHVCPIQANNGQDFGWMRSLPLDWTKPLQVQVPDAKQSLQDLDLVVASDCVWLKSMLESLLDTVASIFDVSGPKTSFILSFQRRDKNGRNNRIPNQTSDQPSRPPSSSSSMFTTVESILDAIEQRGWTWECLAWRYTMVEAEEHEKEECNGGDMLRREVYVVEVRPSSLVNRET